MPTLAAHTLEQRIEEADRLIASLQLLIEQQLIHVNELAGDPYEARRARATADNWLAELSLVRLHRTNLYMQLAFTGTATVASKVS